MLLGSADCHESLTVKGDRLGNRVAPAKARKSCIVSISGYPFGAGLYSECREISIRNQVATCVHCLAETDEYFPVTWPWGNRNAVGPIPNLRYKIKSGLQRGRLMENTWMCHHSEEPGQCKIRQTIACVAVNNTLQPVSIATVTSDVDPMGVHKDVNVDENQGRAP
jgi:hypothetical protein